MGLTWDCREPAMGCQGMPGDIRGPTWRYGTTMALPCDAMRLPWDYHGVFMRQPLDYHGTAMGLSWDAMRRNAMQGGCHGFIALQWGCMASS